MNRPLKLSLAVALALGSSNVLALGLGGIQVRSKMNEPLVAEIPVVVADADEAESLKVQLAGAADFKRVGLDAGGLTVPLEFSVSRDSAGNPVVLVTSTDPVREPFINFLMEVNWSNGRLLREFSVLLDPPVAPAVIGTRTVVETVPEAAPVAAQPLEPVAQEPAPLPEPVPEPAPEPPAPEPAPSETASLPPTEPVAPAETAAEPATEPQPSYEPTPEPASEPVAETPIDRPPGEYGPVASGETLWEISGNTRHSGVTRNQMMLAILRANPDAFFRDNVNALKRGAVLRIPTSEEAEVLAAVEAAAEIASQHEVWASERASALVADSGYGAAPAPTSPPRETPADSRLELIPPRAGAAASGSDRGGVSSGTDTSAALRTDLARTQEQLASREQEANELRTRVQELEKIRTDSDQLLTLKDSEIADLARRLREAEAESRRLREATEAAAAAAASEPAPVPVSEPAPEPVAPIDSTATPGTDTTAATEPAPTPIEPAPDATLSPDTTASTTPDGGAEVTPLPETPVSEPAPVAATPPATDAAVAAQPIWKNPYVLGGAGGVVVLALLGLAVSRRRKPVVVDTGERSSVADQFSSGVFGGGAAGGEGDEEHALLERLAGDPTDPDAHLDLLRYYYANRDADKFEAAAGALYAQLPGPDNAPWEEAVAMGRELCPGNPLFEPEAPISSAPREEFDFDSLEAHAPTTQDRLQFNAPPKPAPAPAPAPARQAENFDFNLIDDKRAAAPAKAAPAKPAPAKATPAPSMDFDVSLDPPELKTQQLPALDLGFVENAPAPESKSSSQEFFSGEDAVGTKLDLARAYLDMGDPEGAKSMLQEVVAEGTDAQRAEARRLLTEIG